MARFTDWFCGNEISEYGKENGFVDYRTFAKAFDAVLNNDIMSKTWGVCGEWEQESGFVDNSEAIEEIQDKIDELTETLNDLEDDEASDVGRENIMEKIEELEDKIRILEDEQDYPPEVYQWYIIDDRGAELCKEYGEIVYYNDVLDMYLWGVTHYGTAWDYVLTNIPCNPTEK